jgi:hypothetical protein
MRATSLPAFPTKTTRGFSVSPIPMCVDLLVIDNWQERQASGMSRKRMSNRAKTCRGFFEKQPASATACLRHAHQLAWKTGFWLPYRSIRRTARLAVASPQVITTQSVMDDCAVYLRDHGTRFAFLLGLSIKYACEPAVDRQRELPPAVLNIHHRGLSE